KGWPTGGEVASVRSRTARVMMTLMRNGRDRRSENPLRATRGKNACFCLGPISGSHQGQQPKRLHSKAEYMAAPERFAETSDSFPLHRGRRPYMAAQGREGLKQLLAIIADENDERLPIDARASLIVLAAQLQALQTLIGSIEKRLVVQHR